MRLPGTRYQEHGWEQVRKLLGQCSLQAFRRLDLLLALDPLRHGELLDGYIEALALALRAGEKSARAEAPGNSYGDSVCELALSLAFELQAQPAYWGAFLATLAAGHARCGPFWLDPGCDAMLRKKVNDMYAGLRDKVDAENYMVATGRDCSPNKIYTYRMLDTAYREIAQLFAGWDQHLEQVGAILGRTLAGMPIEARQLKSIGGCRAEWVIRWSATLERFGGAPGPLHTRSKRFSSLKNSADRMAALMAEIGDYEELSSNLDRGEPGQGDAEEAALWLEDYWRVIGDSEAREAAPQAETRGADLADQILAPPEEDEEARSWAAYAADGAADLDCGDQGQEASSCPVPAEERAAAALALPPRYLESARAAQHAGSWTQRMLNDVSMPIRLAVYHKLLGAADDCYPEDWLDPASGQLPTLQQLATLDGISMPTLRKRRNDAIARLYAATGAPPP